MSAVAVRDRVVRTHTVARQGVRAFYSRPLAWGALAITSAALAYGGGGVMYWFHGIYRGEQGPPVPHWAHWLFDSTLGFVALTPALFFILPAALWAVGRLGNGAARWKSAAYVALVGVLFGVVTGPRADPAQRPGGAGHAAGAPGRGHVRNRPRRGGPPR